MDNIYDCMYNCLIAILFFKDKSKALSRKNVELVSGETARLNCNVVRQDRSSRIEWLRRAEVNGSSVDSAGAPLFEVLEVYTRFVIEM